MRIKSKKLNKFYIIYIFILISFFSTISFSSWLKCPPSITVSCTKWIPPTSITAGSCEQISPTTITASTSSGKTIKMKKWIQNVLIKRTHDVKLSEYYWGGYALHCIYMPGDIDYRYPSDNPVKKCGCKMGPETALGYEWYGPTIECTGNIDKCLQ